MTLKAGRYRIRYVPVGVEPPFVGGMYATACDIGEPIHTSAARPPFHQVWEVRRKTDGKYVITQPGFKSKYAGVGPVLMGWSLANRTSESYPVGNILLRPECTEFEIEPTGQGESLMYSIQPPFPKENPPVGVAFYVTTNHGHDIVSKAFGLGNPGGHPFPRPHWQFFPAEGVSN